MPLKPSLGYFSLTNILVGDMIGAPIIGAGKPVYSILKRNG